jgi:eukaryotic-like serine/threonine-protein kinase
MLIGKLLHKRYKILRQLGSGGFGDTYLAQDLRYRESSLRVVKHLKPKNLTPNILDVAKTLFEREASFLYRLGQCDRIPTLYAHFEEAKEFYLVQEFIEGHDLTQELILGQPWSEEKTTRLLQELLEVLAVVHRENAIHRDIKPSNIMRRKRNGKLVLIDFGAVKEINNLTVDSDGQTSVTIGIGSPGYMPNEQSNGKPKLASDVYAVGAIGIQALTGIKPDRLEENPQTGELIWQHLAPQTSDRLVRILSKMVSSHFRDRYQNASEALKALLAPVVPTAIAPTATTVQAPLLNEPLKRSKISLGAIVTGLIVTTAIALGGVAATNIQVPEASSTASLYKELEAQLAAGEWQKADLQTNRIMLHVANREKEGWLNSRSIKKFSCSDFQRLDRLWLNYSNGYFGFSVQKPIYLKTGNPLGEFDPIAYRRFGEQVGWREKGYWKSYADLTFTKQAPKGHLPRWGPFNDLGDWEESILIERCTK